MIKCYNYDEDENSGASIYIISAPIMHFCYKWQECKKYDGATYNVNCILESSNAFTNAISTCGGIGQNQGLLQHVLAEIKHGSKNPQDRNYFFLYNPKYNGHIESSYQCFGDIKKYEYSKITP